jgi:fucose permease
MIWMAVSLAFVYPLIFPYLPSRLFAVKGIFLGLLAWLITLIYFYATQQDYYSIIPVMLFLLATSIFVGLSYTGNSAVSNYSRVRRESMLFLPLVVVLYLLTIPAWFLFKG